MVDSHRNRLGTISTGKRSQLVFVISLLILAFTLDSYVVVVYPAFKSIEFTLKTIFIPVLCIMILRFAECQKYLSLIDFIALAVVNVVFFICAFTTGTLLSGEYIWVCILSSTLICIVPIKHCHLFELSTEKFRFIAFTLNTTSVVTIVWNIDFWVFQKFDGVNSNAACAFAGLCLTFIAGIFRAGKLSEKQKISLKNTSVLLLLSIISSNSRSGLIWIGVSLLIFLDGVNRRHLIKKIAILTISLFYFSSVFVTFIVLTNSQESFIPLLEQMTALRAKGEIGSDVGRLRYSDVVFNYLGNTRFLTGAGFGKRDYRDTLGEGEDVHNAFLTTLSDSGYIGSFTLVFLCFFWPIIRSDKSASMRSRNFFIACILSSATFFPAPIYGNQFFSVAILYCSLLWLDPESKQIL